MQIQHVTESEAAAADVGAMHTAPLPARRASRLGAWHWLRLLLSDRKAALGLAILAFFVLAAIVGPIIWSGDPSASDYSAIRQPPSAAHWFGTDQQGHDMFRQMLFGTRSPLVVGASVGVIATAIGIIVGMTAGYFGGWIDEFLSLLINVFLVLPSLPLVVVLASWMRMTNDLPTILILSFTGWAWGARVLRSQTMSIRQKDFVLAAMVRGEPGWRIVLREIVPNMISLIASNFIGTALAAIATTAGLIFIGLGNISGVSWFTMLYWAQNGQVFLTGAWWTFVPPGLALAILGMACALINFGIDTISNPRLRTDGVKPPRRRRALTPARQAVAVEKGAPAR